MAVKRLDMLPDGCLGILVSPLVLMGLFNENVQHYVSIELPDNKKGGVLIQAHKDNYRNVLALLRGATAKEIEMEKKGRDVKKPSTTNKGSN
jgi:hypothetical protein